MSMLFLRGSQSLLKPLRPQYVVRSMASLPHRRFQQKQRRNEIDLSHATAMPISVREMDNSSLITLAALDDHKACTERLIRHIMAHHSISYYDAQTKFFEIQEFHKEGRTMMLLPYHVGIATALVAGFGSIPLCFHLPSVHWFNELYVTTDIPEPRDLETWLEVGAWSWNWMEPALGQISFLLLCLQFSRAQLSNLGIRPYTRRVKERRVQRLLARYPEYNSEILAQYSRTAKLVE